mgnify:CR=1 FL=1
MRIAVVTGASSGIGREFCSQLDKKTILTKCGSLPAGKTVLQVFQRS